MVLGSPGLCLTQGEAESWAVSRAPSAPEPVLLDSCSGHASPTREPPLETSELLQELCSPLRMEPLPLQELLRAAPESMRARCTP